MVDLPPRLWRLREPSVRDLIEVALRQALTLRPGTLGDLGLQLQGFGVALRLDEAGRIRYELGDGRGLWASEVGKTYVLGKLQKVHGVTYEPTRDLPRLQ